MGLNGEGRVVAFGDFNGDQSCVFMSLDLSCALIILRRLDVLMLDKDQQVLSMYYWNHGAFTDPSRQCIILIYHIESFSFSFSENFKHPKKVVNVVPGDFTHSGKLDLLVFSPGRNNELDLTLYPSLVGDGFGN